MAVLGSENVRKIIVLDSMEFNRKDRYMMMELILTRSREDIIRNSIFENLKYLVFKYVFQQVVTEAIHLCRYDDETYTDETSYSDLLSYYNQQFHIGCHFAIITLYVTHGMRYYTA